MDHKSQILMYLPSYITPQSLIKLDLKKKKKKK